MYLVPEKSYRDVSLSRNGPGRDAGHFVSFRDCPGQSGTPGHPSPTMRGVLIVPFPSTTILAISIESRLLGGWPHALERAPDGAIIIVIVVVVVVVKLPFVTRLNKKNLAQKRITGKSSHNKS